MLPFAACWELSQAMAYKEKLRVLEGLIFLCSRTLVTRLINFTYSMNGSIFSPKIFEGLSVKLDITDKFLAKK